MLLSDIGRIVEDEWLRTPTVRANVELDAYVIMPNHVHGIIIMGDCNPDSRNNVGTHSSASLRTNDATSNRVTPLLYRKPNSLGSIIAGFKSAATRRINIWRNTPGAHVWQGNYHDHIIRNDRDLHRIREYIANNPLKWSLDRENSDAPV